MEAPVERGTKLRFHDIQRKKHLKSPFSFYWWLRLSEVMTTRLNKQASYINWTMANLDEWANAYNDQVGKMSSSLKYILHIFYINQRWKQSGCGGQLSIIEKIYKDFDRICYINGRLGISRACYRKSKISRMAWWNLNMYHLTLAADMKDNKYLLDLGPYANGLWLHLLWNKSVAS